MPQNSIGKRQAALLNDGFLDLTGSDRLEYAPVSLDALSGKLAEIAIKFALIAREKLQQTDRIATGALADSIIPTEVKIFGGIYQVNINVADYYKFVDEGVKGWQDEKGGNSPYQFKQYSGRSGAKESKMVSAIKQWLLKEGLKGKGSENSHKKASIRDNRRSTITDSTTRTAIIISKSIRKKGLKPSHFWSATISEVEKMLHDQLGAALKIDIVNNITNVQ